MSSYFILELEIPFLFDYKLFFFFVIWIDHCSVSKQDYYKKPTLSRKQTNPSAAVAFPRRPVSFFWSLWYLHLFLVFFFLSRWIPTPIVICSVLCSLMKLLGSTLSVAGKNQLVTEVPWSFSELREAESLWWVGLLGLEYSDNRFPLDLSDLSMEEDAWDRGVLCMLHIWWFARLVVRSDEICRKRVVVFWCRRSTASVWFWLFSISAKWNLKVNFFKGVNRSEMLMGIGSSGSCFMCVWTSKPP